MSGGIGWGKYEKTYRRGTKVRIRRPEGEWITVPAEHLRIVSDELWFAAHAQMRHPTRDPNKKGAKKSGGPPRYLLSGVGRCGQCGGPMTVINGRDGTKPIKVYVCAYHRNRGDTVCDNSLRRPAQVADQVVTRWLHREVLKEEIVLAALEEVRLRLAERARAKLGDLPALEKEGRKLRQEIAEVKARVKDLRRVLERNPDECRALLNLVLVGRVTFKPVDRPEGRRYEVHAKASRRKILAAAMSAARVSNQASPGRIGGSG